MSLAKLRQKLATVSLLQKTALSTTPTIGRYSNQSSRPALLNNQPRPQQPAPQQPWPNIIARPSQPDWAQRNIIAAPTYNRPTTGSPTPVATPAPATVPHQPSDSYGGFAPGPNLSWERRFNFGADGQLQSTTDPLTVNRPYDFLWHDRQKELANLEGTSEPMDAYNTTMESMPNQTPQATPAPVTPPDTYHADQQNQMRRSHQDYLAGMDDIVRRYGL